MTDTVPKVLGSALAHALDGANVVDDLGSPTAGDYGDPVREYELAARRRGGRRSERRWRGARRRSRRRLVPRQSRLAGSHAARRRRGRALVAAATAGQAHRRLPAAAGRRRGVLARHRCRCRRAARRRAEPVQDPGAGRCRRRSSEFGRISIKGPRAVARVGDALGVAVPDAAARARRVAAARGSCAPTGPGFPASTSSGRATRSRPRGTRSPRRACARAGLAAFEARAGRGRCARVRVTSSTTRRSRRRRSSSATRCRSPRAASSARSWCAASTRVVT